MVSQGRGLPVSTCVPVPSPCSTGHGHASLEPARGHGACFCNEQVPASPSCGWVSGNPEGETASHLLSLALMGHDPVNSLGF